MARISLICSRAMASGLLCIAAVHGFYIGPKGRPFCCSTRRKTVPALKSPPRASGWPSICPPSSASSSQKGAQEELRRHRIDTLPAGVSSLDHFQDLRSFVSSPQRGPGLQTRCSRVSETARFCPRPPRAASLRPGRVFPEHAAACDARQARTAAFNRKKPATSESSDRGEY